jgi:N-acetylmuramoyl-L-alanine amidase
MNRLQYIVVHCLDTPRGRWITKGDLEMWHKGPRDLLNGKVRFLGRDYTSREDLPMVKINGVWVKKLNGRGWDRLGYADLIHHSGDIENLTSYDKDDFVDSDEITWGAVGINSVSRHVALEGGIHPVQGQKPIFFDFMELYTHRQWHALEDYLKQAVVDHPWVKIIGHSQVAYKSCPNTSIPEYCQHIGIPKENYIESLKVNV